MIFVAPFFGGKIKLGMNARAANNGQTPILAGQIMNTNNFFLPKEYPIMLAIDRYYYIDVHIFDSNLVKNAFARCRVPFRGFHAF